MARGYGNFIARIRDQEGMSPEQLAKAIGRKTKTTVYRIESEKQEPTADDINALVSALPMSSYTLLRLMGLHLPWTRAGEIEDRLLEFLIDMGPEARKDLLAFLERTYGRAARPRADESGHQTQGAPQ